MKYTIKSQHTNRNEQAGFTHLLVILSFLVLFGAVGTYLLVASHAAPLKPAPAKTITWLINAGAVKQLSSAGASTSLINTAFANNHTYEISNGSTGTIGIPTVSYSSYTALQQAFTSGTLPGHYKAVLYDNENWSLTPIVEQKSPAHYEYLVAQLLHQHHLLYIATPAADIVKAVTPKATNIYTTYLQDHIAANAGRYADVFDIQAQGSEANLTQFKSFVSSASQQARQANTKVKVLVGLSTNPDGRSVTSTQFNNAYTAALPYADGFWLNIPGQSTQCPNCGVPQPKLGLELLQKIY